jgi:hypothetical protein
VTAISVVAGVIIGLFLGWCMTMVITFAMLSRSQERMQRKVSYWQAETSRAQAQTAKAQAEADRLLAQVTPHRRMPPGPDHEPWEW